MVLWQEKLTRRKLKITIVTWYSGVSNNLKFDLEIFFSFFIKLNLQKLKNDYILTFKKLEIKLPVTFWFFDNNEYHLDQISTDRGKSVYLLR